MDSMVGDIVERDASAAAPQEPKPPSGPAAAPKKRWGGRRRPVVLDPSANAAAAVPRPARPAPAMAEQTPAAEAPLSDAERMHLENIRRMQKMTPEQIAEEREEIFRTMDPNVLQSLLRRAELKEEETRRAPATVQQTASTPQTAPKPQTAPNLQTASSPQATAVTPPQADVFQSQRLKKGALLGSDEVDDLLTPQLEPKQQPIQTGVDSIRAVSPEDKSEPAAEPAVEQERSTVHFPPPPEELRKYFPDLPVETEKLAWMQPIAADEEQEYSDQLVSVAPSELRFDFNGNVVTPRVSRLIDPSHGLHHHGDAPSAAGYTLPELAHLSRSSHPAQRAMAIQTAGRVLHKLRLRKYAKSTELQEGLQQLVRETRIMETLTEAAAESTRSLTVRTYAAEALWLANTGDAPAR